MQCLGRVEALCAIGGSNARAEAGNLIKTSVPGSVTNYYNNSKMVKHMFSHAGDHPTPLRCPRNVSRAIMKNRFFMIILMFWGTILGSQMWRITNKWQNRWKSTRISTDLVRFRVGFQRFCPMLAISNKMRSKKSPPKSSK